MNSASHTAIDYPFIQETNATSGFRRDQIIMKGGDSWISDASHHISKNNATFTDFGHAQKDVLPSFPKQRDIQFLWTQQDNILPSFQTTARHVVFPRAQKDILPSSPKQRDIQFLWTQQDNVRHVVFPRAEKDILTSSPKQRDLQFLWTEKDLKRTLSQSFPCLCQNSASVPHKPCPAAL
jgi:hypothetical protein